MKILTYSSPGTRDILENNKWMNNRNIKFEHRNNYISIPEINANIDDIPVDIDAIIFDFIPDVLFGTVIVNHSAKTKNFWKKDYPEQAIDYVSKDLDNLELFNKELDKFVEKLRNEKVEIILNSYRFPDYMTINGDGRHPLPNSFPSPQERTRINSKLEKLEQHVREKYKFIHIIDFDKDNSLNEANHPIKQYSFYFNDAYYLDSFIKLEQILENKFSKQVPHYQIIKNLDELCSGDVLLVSEELNIIKLAWSNESVNRFLTSVSNNDYILDGNIGKTFRFIRRTDFYRPSLKEWETSSGNKIFYADDLDKIRNKSGKVKNIIFFFCGMPGSDYLNSLDAYERMFPRLFKDFTRSLTKDTIVIRIADVNGVRGGFYVNTYNYEQQENDLSEFIYAMIKTYNVSDKNIVFHGTSKGATGALYYAAKHDLNCVAVDPVLDSEDSILNLHNNHFMKDFRIEQNLVIPINYFEQLNSRNSTHYVVGNHFVNSTWSVIQKLKKYFCLILMIQRLRLIRQFRLILFLNG